MLWKSHQHGWLGFTTLVPGQTWINRASGRPVSASTQMHCSLPTQRLYFFGDCQIVQYIFFWRMCFLLVAISDTEKLSVSLLSLWGTTPKFAEFELLSQSHFPRNSFDGPGKFEQHYLFQHTSHFALFAPGTPLTKPHFFYLWVCERTKVPPIRSKETT